jgi:hypothetical protein
VYTVFKRIPGACNPANEPSHNRPVNKAKLEEAILVVDGKKAALVEAPPPARNAAGLRHNIDEVVDVDEEAALQVVAGLADSFEDETVL